MLPLIFRWSTTLVACDGSALDPLPPPLRCLLAGEGVTMSSPPGGEAAALAFVVG